MSDNKPRLILGSASPRRLDLLAQIGVTPDLVQGADIDETPKRGEVPDEYCLRVALEKNAILAAQFPDDFILTADTTAALGRRILGKSDTKQEAEAMLRLLSGRSHLMITALVLKAPGKKPAYKINTTRLTMKRLGEEELKNYLAGTEWQGVAGSFNFQKSFAYAITKIHGSPSGVIGLPLYETMQLLKGAGYDYPL